MRSHSTWVAMTVRGHLLVWRLQHLHFQLLQATCLLLKFLYLHGRSPGSRGSPHGRLPRPPAGRHRGAGIVRYIAGRAEEFGARLALYWLLDSSADVRLAAAGGVNGRVNMRIVEPGSLSLVALIRNWIRRILHAPCWIRRSAMPDAVACSHRLQVPPGVRCGFWAGCPTGPARRLSRG